MRDYGFELPDVRHEYYAKDGGNVSVVIVRHWYQNEDDDTSFKVSFNLHYSSLKNRSVVNLPVGIDESKALSVAHELWQEDEESSQELYEMRAEEGAERRAGA